VAPSPLRRTRFTAPPPQGFSDTLRNLCGQVAIFLFGKRAEPADRVSDDDATATSTHDATVVAPIGDDVIAEACRRVCVKNPLRRDFNGRTVHAIVTGADGSKAWLKVSGIPLDTQDPCREAEIEADRQLGLPRPKVIATSAWNQDGRSWRAILMQLAPSDAAARHAWSAPSSSDIPESWFMDLRKALRAVQHVCTSRFICTPTEISDAIERYLPAGVPTKADAWYVQHGDLQWSNLTLPHLTLLDWEVWGLAPVGYGTGRLLTFSLLAPEVAHKLEETFEDEFSTPSGRVGVLAAIALVMSQIEEGNVPKELEAPIQGLIDRILDGDFGKAHRAPNLATALEALPAPYQPIYGHLELSKSSMRPSSFRFAGTPNARLVARCASWIWAVYRSGSRKAATLSLGSIARRLISLSVGPSRGSIPNSRPTSRSQP
jgi:hypothetical protein